MPTFPPFDYIPDGARRLDGLDMSDAAARARAEQRRPYNPRRVTLAAFRKRALEIADGEQWLCVFCGVNVANSREHFIPKARRRPGAGDDLNLLPACMPCNQLKGSHALWDWLPILQRRFMNVVQTVFGRTRPRQGGGWVWR